MANITVISFDLGDQLRIQHQTPAALFLVNFARVLAACGILAFPFLLPYICDFFHVPGKYEGMSNEEVDELERIGVAAGSSSSSDVKIGTAAF
ncbi:hypothetical protein MMC30_002435 [Trapelia coarctata]|nr:hypothetical protein [Trapelia coarctata]